MVLFDAFMRPLALNVGDFLTIQRKCATLSARVFDFYFDPTKTAHIDKRGFSRFMMLAKLLRNADAETKTSACRSGCARRGCPSSDEAEEGVDPRTCRRVLARLRQDFGLPAFPA
jgi:hypothetical protein